MTDKQKTPRSKFRKIAIITGAALVVLAIIVRIGFMVAAGNDQVSASIVQVDGLSDNTVTTTDINYKLSYTVEKPADTSVTRTVKTYVNDKEVTTIRDYSTTNPARYTSSLGSKLKSGDNNAKIVVSEKEIGEAAKTAETKQFKINLKATEKPIVDVERTTLTDDDSLQIKTRGVNSYDLKINTTPKDSKNSGATSLTINGKAVAMSATSGQFKYRVDSLKIGDNTFTITAKNDIGEATVKLVIKRLSTAEEQKAEKANDTKSTAVDDVIFEAEITCQEYAEQYFKVSNVNIHYGSGTLEKKNPDGTVLIKLAISDSKGFFHADQPLGTMECTTDATGMTVLNFVTY